MTVKELITILNEFPENAEICMIDNHTYMDIGTPKEVWFSDKTFEVILESVD